MSDKADEEDQQEHQESVNAIKDRMIELLEANDIHPCFETFMALLSLSSAVSKQIGIPALKDYLEFAEIAFKGTKYGANTTAH